MNESYDPKREFTVADLLTYDLEEHAQLIHSIYLGAVAEYDLELKIGYLKKFWEEREFKLAKHIPDSLLQSKGKIVLWFFVHLILSFFILSIFNLR